MILNIETKPSEIALARTAKGVSFFLTRERYVALNEFLVDPCAALRIWWGLGMVNAPMLA